MGGAESVPTVPRGFLFEHTIDLENKYYMPLVFSINSSFCLGSPNLTNF